LTQQALSERADIHVTLLRRYEAGKTQPGLDALRKIALALNVSADQLLFDPDERGPSDDLRLQFEAVSRLDPDERNVVKSLIEGMLLKHEAKRWAA
ncbi:MAG TPA: helix-turn-helix transcriptional regulator, partial [Baekduia sp.]|nr:helix-turn-helix transcriptional regulator [Baekduia sp.]